MNTALRTYKVHFCGSFWVVFCGEETWTCVTTAQLKACLSNNPESFQGKTRPERSFESVDHYLARGGEVTQVGRVGPVLPLPAPAPYPKPHQKLRLTLADLGLLLPTIKE